jgi:flagellar M-ring protein FliF
VQREVEGYLEKKAQDIVAQVVGVRNARVQVAAEINFDKVERTVEAVDPDKQAVATEQRAEITPGAQGGAASTNVATSYETTKSTETFSGAIGNVRRLSVAVLVNDKLAGGPSPKAVPRTPVELARLDTLVRNAVGADTARGDKVSVVNVAFDGLAAPTADERPDVWSRVSQAEKPLVAGAALVAILVAAFLTTRALKPAVVPAEPAATRALTAGTGLDDRAVDGDDDTDAALPAGELAALAAGATAAGALPAGAAAGVVPAGMLPGAPDRPLPPQIANPVREQVLAIIDQRPEAATRVVRAWLKQD